MRRFAFELHRDFDFLLRPLTSTKLSGPEDSRPCLLWGVVCIKYLINSCKKGEFSKNDPHKVTPFFSTTLRVEFGNKRGSFSLVPIDKRPFPILTLLTFWWHSVYGAACSVDTKKRILRLVAFQARVISLPSCGNTVCAWCRYCSIMCSLQRVLVFMWQILFLAKINTEEQMVILDEEHEVAGYFEFLSIPSQLEPHRQHMWCFIHKKSESSIQNTF